MSNMEKKILFLISGTVTILVVLLIIFNPFDSPQSKLQQSQTVDDNTTIDSQKSKQVETDFSTINDTYRFSAKIPKTWRVEFVPETQAINIFNPDLSAENNLEKSQIFIRYFEANDFLTLNTVDILSRQETEINDHPAVRYEIVKKSSVPDFANQPLWRSKQHKLIDVRLSKASPSLFYVFAVSPDLPQEIFEDFLDSLLFHNDSESFVFPLDQPSARITKKPFGIFITQNDSPVQPERFSGFHTGTDFEILSGEEIIDVPIMSVCGGKLALKKQISGYGGVAIQDCLLEDEPITVLYGHLRLSSISSELGKYITPGQTIGTLGAGFSVETDGERKHLHLGIHAGSGIELAGYTNDQSKLSEWMNILNILE